LKAAPIAVERIERAILVLRGHKVMLDADLAALYDVETRILVQAVKRNQERFPEDFMFQLEATEVERLRSQTVISNAPGRGGRRYAPYAFTEQGVAMLSTVLNSPRAIAVNIEIMRTFVRLRRILASNKELARRLNALEAKTDANFAVVFEAIRQLMAPPESKKRPIGFVTPKEEK
jgi:hypothetical protein